MTASNISRSRLRAPRPKKLARAIAAALVIPAAGAHIATAQDAGQQAPDEIVITGSRIVRRDFQANSPIQTIDASAFGQQASLAIEDAVNDLPQFVPAATGLTQLQDGELINTGASLTAGASTLSLRGLGPNRNLVLLDGYRAMPVNGTMAVDLNSIPAAAIDRVETITGGASSVYGADAVAGVVNFILKHDFEGLRIDAQYGAMQNGDAGEKRSSVLFGVNSGDGRGNVMIGLEYADREGVLRNDVDFYRKGYEDPTVEGTHPFYTGPYYNIDALNPPNGAVIDGIFNKVAPGVVLRSATGAISGRAYWTSHNTIYTGGSVFNGVSPAGAGSTAGSYRYDDPLRIGDFQYRKFDTSGAIEDNFIGHRANVPLNRYSIFGRGRYDITDKVSAYTQILSVESRTLQESLLSPAAGGWGTVVPHGGGVYAPSLAADGVTTRPAYMAGGQFGLNCPATGGCTNSQAFPVPAELQALLDSRANPNAPWSLNYSLDQPYFGLAAPRSVDSTIKTNQVSFGLQGKLGGIDGSWDFIVSHGTNTVGMKLPGYVSRERYRALVASPNYGHGFFAQGNVPGGGFAAGVASCASGVPIFGPHDQISADCLKILFVEMNNQADMKQDFVEANVQGRLVKMPAGEARFSAGVHSRENTYQYLFDPLNAESSFLDGPVGNFPADNTEGSTSVDEVYGELLLPLMQGRKGARHLNAELGYRYSDYERQGGVDTYKALLDWGITDTLRFRGGRQLATRAPNIAELFQAQSQTYTTGPTGDPCGLNTNAAYGANPAGNPNAAQARSLCQQLMGSVGAAVFYDPATPRPNGTFGTYWLNTIGNPNVLPEEAKTWTAGFVWQPNTGHALRDGFSSTIDWYQIKIADMIAVENAENVYETCLSVATNPTADINNPACQRIIRNPATGGATATNVTYTNRGNAKVSGVDLSANWRVNLADMGMERMKGYFGINFMLTYLLDLKTQSSRNAPTIDWKGSLGPDPGTSLNNGAYDYRLLTTVSYGFNDWDLNLRWRHLPSAIAAQAAVSRVPVTYLGAQDSYDVFDLAANWSVGEKTTMRMGVDNLLDTPPVVTGGRSALDPNPTTGQGTTEAGFYDILGRQFYVGVQVAF